MTKLLLVGLGVPGLGMAFLVGAAAAEGSLPPLSALILPLFVVVVLVAVNGFFVAAEFAIIGVRVTQIEQLSIEGNQRPCMVSRGAVISSNPICKPGSGSCPARRTRLAILWR